MDQELKNSIVKSGTTIVGIVCKDGVIMAADRQTTAGHMVMHKNSEKVVKINDYLLVSGTGIASDIRRVERLLAAELKLKELKSKTRPTVKVAASLLANIIYSNVRQFSTIPSMVGTLIAGLNEDGSAELYTIDPSGHISQVDDYDSNFGSGMPFVIGLLERQYKENITLKEGVLLATEALKSSTQRDVGSGHGIDIFTISKEGIKKVVSQEILPDYKEETIKK